MATVSGLGGLERWWDQWKGWGGICMYWRGQWKLEGGREGGRYVIYILGR